MLIICYIRSFCVVYKGIELTYFRNWSYSIIKCFHNDHHHFFRINVLIHCVFTRRICLEIQPPHPRRNVRDIIGAATPVNPDACLSLSHLPRRFPHNFGVRGSRVEVGKNFACISIRVHPRSSVDHFRGHFRGGFRGCFRGSVAFAAHPGRPPDRASSLPPRPRRAQRAALSIASTSGGGGCPGETAARPATRTR